MSAFIRIKDYVINLESVAYVRVETNSISFAFASRSDASKGQNHIQFEKGTHLQDPEFEQLKEFVLQLPEADRMIVV